MQTTTRALALALPFAAPVAATAENWTGAATLGYERGEISQGGGDATVYSLDLSGRGEFANGFILNYDATLMKGEVDNVSGELSVKSFALAPRYRFGGSRFSAGLYVEHGVLDYTGLVSNLEATSYGVTGNYEHAGWQVELYYGGTETDPDLPSGVDVYDYGLKLGVAPTENVTIAGNLMRTRIDSGGGYIDSDLLQLAGTYKVNEGLAFFGGASFGELSGFGASADVNTFGLGGSYYLGANSGLPVTLSLEAARSEISSGGSTVELDSVRFGVTLPLGGKTAKLPLNSVAGGIQNARHSTITTGLLN